MHDLATTLGEPLATALAGGGAPAIARALLDALERDPPGVAIVEDAHWADNAPVDVLRLVPRRRDGSYLLRNVFVYAIGRRG